MANKPLIFIFFFLLSIKTFGQHKSFTPTRGEIAFSSTEIIPDTAYFVASIKDKNKKLVDRLIKKLNIDASEKIDTANILALMSSNISPELSADKSDYHFLYQDSLIESYKTINSKRTNSYSVINTKQAIYTDIMVFEDDTSSSDPVNFQYLKLKDINIQEFRGEKKVINGYECFKVTSTYKIVYSDEDEMIEAIAENEECKAVYWVTDKIKSPFHPISKEKEILDKYYPLEITYNNPVHKGMSLVYKLKSISLAN